MKKLTRAWLGYVAGCVCIVAGVWVQFGTGYALIVAGAVLTASYLLLSDVDDDPDGEVGR
ncbi:MAG TPA: hypothetical protein VFV66_28455 [Nonomuraea sp.]|nr:hypothetical protein [Nonomuraea sp.]